MVDTVRFQLTKPPKPDQLRRFAYIRKPRRKGGVWKKYWIHIKAPNGTYGTLTHYPQDPDGNPVSKTLLEASLPNLVDGDNLEMLMDPAPALRILETLVHPFLTGPVDLWKSELDLIHLPYNHPLAPMYVDAIIRQIRKLQYPRRAAKPYYPQDGVRFQGGESHLHFYINAAGLLREELQLESKRAVRDALGHLDKPAYITDFTPCVVQELLRAENMKLGLEGTAFLDEAAALRELLATHGSEHGMRELGYLHALEIASPKELIAMGVPERTLYRNKKSLAAIQLANSLLTEAPMLPVISVDMPDCHGVAS